MSAFGARRARSATIDVLPPDPGTRRHSAGAAYAGRPLPEVVDAVFVVLPEQPASVRMQAGNEAAGSRHACRSGLGASGSSVGRLVVKGIAAVLLLVERGLQVLPSRAFGAVVAGCFTTAFFFAGGLSALATVFSGDVTENAGLRVADVTSSLDDRDGMKVLSVYGTVENRARDARPLTAIRIDIISGGRTLARHRIETSATSMAPGAVRPFSLKIPHAGSNLPKVEVSLVVEDALLR